MKSKCVGGFGGENGIRFLERGSLVLRTVRFVLFVFFLALLVQILPLFSATLTWTGAGSLNYWSLPTNWNPHVTPQSFDSLVFFGAVNARNDMTGLNVSSITLNGTSAPRIYGNAIGLI